MTNAMLSIDALRTDVREWSEGLPMGCEDPEWIRQAGRAMESRARGELGDGIWEAEEGGGAEGEEEPVGEEREAWWKDPYLK
jgi:hypothetical protein